MKVEVKFEFTMFITKPDQAIQMEKALIKLLKNSSLDQSIELKHTADRNVEYTTTVHSI